MMMKKMLFAAMMAAGVFGNALAESIELNDTFDNESNWNTNKYWRITDDGQMRGEAASSTFLLLKKETVCNNISLEIDMTIIKGQHGSWKTSGIAIYTDDKNYWAFSAVESPEKDGKKHFFELKEMLDGKWGAESNLTKNVSKGWFNWEYNTPYRLKLTLSGQSITGVVMDSQGKTVAEVSFNINSNALKCGRPALRVSGMSANFDNAKINGQ